jgi:hypothetical protein
VLNSPYGGRVSTKRRAAASHCLRRASLTIAFSTMTQPFMGLHVMSMTSSIA